MIAFEKTFTLNPVEKFIRYGDIKINFDQILELINKGEKIIIRYFVKKGKTKYKPEGLINSLLVMKSDQDTKVFCEELQEIVFNGK
jgi:hypothetical protein